MFGAEPLITKISVAKKSGKKSGHPSSFRVLKHGEVVAVCTFAKSV
jgi:hypothetical protein